MGRQSVKEMSRYQVMHELSVMAGWKYEGSIEHDNEKTPQGSGSVNGNISSTSVYSDAGQTAKGQYH